MRPVARRLSTSKLMADYTATVTWESDSPEAFSKDVYSRGHIWNFDGGVSVPASSSPHSVRPPYSVTEAVDPEEALVASASSCHMLTFLWLAAKMGLNISSYRDEAVGTMATLDDGRQWVATITLNPVITWVGEQPSAETLADLHHRSHEQCYIANTIKSEIKIVCP